MPRWRTLAALAGAALLTSCTGTDIPGGPVPPQDHDPPGQHEQQEADDARIPAAIDDAARRTGTDPASVEVIHFGAVTWPDGSIGCPEDGMAYTQALVDGYRLLLQADGSELSYHAADQDDFFYCPHPEEPLEDPTS